MTSKSLANFDSSFTVNCDQIKEYELNNKTISFILDFAMYSLQAVFDEKINDIIKIVNNTNYGNKFGDIIIWFSV